MNTPPTSTSTPATGLRRFVADPAGSRVPTPPSSARPAEQPAAGREPALERCEMCDTPVEERHGHVVDRESHQLLCTCRACYLLFTGEWTGGRFRAVPERRLTDPRHRLTGADWEQLQVPVGMAFFIRGMADRAVAAFYPSPAGATECLLDLDAWDRLAERNPLLAAAEPEVEAILIRRTDSGIDCYLVPVDSCYELVGAMRQRWRGFDGGAEAKAYIDGFFTSVAQQARAFEAAPGHG
jgi:hypothetical protein